MLVPTRPLKQGSFPFPSATFVAMQDFKKGLSSSVPTPPPHPFSLSNVMHSVLKGQHVELHLQGVTGFKAPQLP